MFFQYKFFNKFSFALFFSITFFLVILCFYLFIVVSFGKFWFDFIFRFNDDRSRSDHHFLMILDELFWFWIFLKKFSLLLMIIKDCVLFHKEFIIELNYWAFNKVEMNRFFCCCICSWIIKCFSFDHNNLLFRLPFRFFILLRGKDWVRETIQFKQEKIIIKEKSFIILEYFTPVAITVFLVSATISVVTKITITITIVCWNCYWRGHDDHFNLLLSW